ncbi:hypothetical protein OF83DRAFT_1167332 [Amylostereum chailletii]|nr:hypothetical protein OF83DRAFT_1167332 [Amylostereum chailletii]
MSQDAHNVPKAVIYLDRHSPWSIAARIALDEKGYGDDEVDVKYVDLAKGENFSPTFLRLNPKGTVPTLIVPFENTLASDTESRYKAVTDTESVVALLDRSRSAFSRTRTTSGAPAISLSPATIALSAVAKNITTLLHSGPASPELLFFMNARNSAELEKVTGTVLPFLKGRKEALERYLSQNETSPVRVSEKTSQFWREKKQSTEGLLAIIEAAGKNEGELDEAGKKAREEYFENTKAAWEVGLSLVLTKLSAELIGPYALGDQFSIVDVHLAAWLLTLVRLCGGNEKESGSVVTGKLEQHVGGGYALPRIAVPTMGGTMSETTTPRQEEVGGTTTTTTTTKLSVFWEAMQERPSWGRVAGAEKSA